MSDRTDWHEWRRGGIGASDVAGIMGVSQWASPWSVWASKVGLTQPNDDDMADHLRLGHDLEPIIARWFCRETGLFVDGEQTWCSHRDDAWQRATVDGFVCDHDDAATPDAALGVFEAKYSGDAPWTDVPDGYRLQAQWQMQVTGLDRVWFAVMHLPFGRPRFRVYEVDRDQAVIDELIAACDAFWHEHCLPGDPPAVDAHPATTAAISEVYGPDETIDEPAVDLDADTERTVAIWASLKQQARDLDGEIAECENAIKVALGEHTAGAGAAGVVVTWKPQTRAGAIDTAALAAAIDVDLAQFRKPASTFRVLRLVKPKEKK